MKLNRRNFALVISIVVVASIIGVWGYSATAANSLVDRLRQTIIVHFADTRQDMVQEAYEPANMEISPEVVAPNREAPPVRPTDEAPVVSLESGQTVTSGNVSVQLQRVDVYSSFTRATACIQLPDNADWLPDASITVNGKRFVAAGWNLLDAKNPATYANSRRCYNFDFPVQPNTGIGSGQIDFSVEKLVTSVPELITEENCRKVQQKLQAAKTGIDLLCKNQGNGSASFEVLRKPASLPHAEVQ
ncbi:MAG: hypothetical protein CVU38_19515, partial [Chloroflexi bacterium HGW-Chloroflexi-1]